MSLTIDPQRDRGPGAPTELPPGPRLPKLVQALRYAFDGPRFFTECRARYGPTWTLRLPGFPPAVVTADRDAVRRLLTGDPLLRRHGNDLLRPLLGDRSVLLLEPDEHLARRRLELPAFHGEALGQYEQRIRELVEEEIATWPVDTVVATHPRARALTLAIILELVLGIRDTDLATTLAPIIDSFNTPLQNLAQFLPAGLMRQSRWNLGARPFYARLDRLHALLGGHIARTRRDPALARRTDVLALLVRARDEHGAALTDADLRAEVLTLILAGHETTATAIAWACDMLAHTPAVVAQLRETLAAGEREYLRATAKEVLRARTIVYVSAARHPLEPLSIGDWVIGANAVVLVDAQGIHGDPQLYPAPAELRPERFLDEPSLGYTYLPFGGGAHRCLGAPLATLELELALEVLVTRVELTPAGPPARAVRRLVTLAPDSQGRVLVSRPRVAPDLRP